MKMQWENIMSIDMAVCVATLLFMDIFDTMGTLIGVGQRVGLANEKGDMPGMNKAFMAVSIFSGRTKELKRTTVMLAMLFVLKYVFL